MTLRPVEPRDGRLAVDADVVRRQRLLQPRVRAVEAQRRGAGEHQVHIDVVQHAGAAPVVAGHEERLERGRAARRGLGRHGEDHPPGLQPAERGPHPRGGVVVEGRRGPPGVVRLAKAGGGVPVLVEAGAHHQRPAGEAAPGPGVDGHRGGVDRDDLVSQRRAAVRDDAVGRAREGRHAWPRRRRRSSAAGGSGAPVATRSRRRRAPRRAAAGPRGRCRRCRRRRSGRRGAAGCRATRPN